MQKKVWVALVLAATMLVSAGAAPSAPRHLKQNWTPSDWQWFYTTAQGSLLIQYAWALALERPESETLFFADSLTRFGYLPNPKSSRNPDGLPVGFVKDSYKGESYVGMTCAACHVGQLNYGGTTYQIDGAPSDAELFRFLAELGRSINETTRQGEGGLKFLRFAKRVLKSGDTPAARQKLFQQLTAFEAYYSEFIRNSTADTEWGPARIDAFGEIFNRVTSIDLQIPENSKKPNAPVSVPFLWDTSWHDWVQWNGSAPNKKVTDRLGRNVGEVLGVFAKIELEKPHGLHRFYESSAQRVNLLLLEDRLSKLHSPKWPAEFPAIDQAKAARGKTIYDAQCLSCHTIAVPETATNVVLTPLSDVGTDPATAVGATRSAKTGRLEGTPSSVLFGDPMKAVESAGTVTMNAVVGAILSPIPEGLVGGIDWKGKGSAERQRVLQQLRAAPKEGSAEPEAGAAAKMRMELHDALHNHATNHKTATTTTSTAAAPPTLVYRARPLDGIWATAPYLHNGSIPNLRQLLMPGSARVKSFTVGSREFDPANVGFRSAEGDGKWTFDTTKPANSNAGHEWGTALSDGDRDALVEYLKTR